MKLYISDLHFFEDIKMDNRGFENIQTMNQYMISQWNKKIKGGDQIYVLGDMFGTKNPDEVNSVLNRLNGKIYLIEGNHDYRWIKKEGININRFEWIKSYAEFDDHGYSVVASHYPTFCYNHQHVRKPDGSHRTYMLYGHVHNSWEMTVLDGPKAAFEKHFEMPYLAFNVGCMLSYMDYTPRTLEEIMEGAKDGNVHSR